MAIRPETDELIDFLNSLIGLDRPAMQELLSVRVPCGRALADHPTVQVTGCTDGLAVGTAFMRIGETRVGVLGLLNGWAGIFDDGTRRGWGPITACYDAGLLVRFERTQNRPAESA